MRSSPAWPVLHWPRPRCCFCCSPAVCHARVLCQMDGAIRACLNVHTRAHADHSRGEETRSNLRNVVDVVVVVVGALFLLKIPLSTHTHTHTLAPTKYDRSRRSRDNNIKPIRTPTIKQFSTLSFANLHHKFDHTSKLVIVIGNFFAQRARRKKLEEKFLPHTLVRERRNAR